MMEASQESTWTSSSARVKANTVSFSQGERTGSSPMGSPRYITFCTKIAMHHAENWPCVTQPRSGNDVGKVDNSAKPPADKLAIGVHISPEPSFLF